MNAKEIKEMERENLELAIKITNRKLKNQLKFQKLLFSFLLIFQFLLVSIVFYGIVVSLTILLK